MKNKKQDKSTLHLYNKILKVFSFIFVNIKFLLRLLFIIIVAGVIGIFILLKNVDPNDYKPILTQTLETTLQRKVKIEGDISWRLVSFEPAIKIEKISISNTKWGKASNIFEANDVFVLLSLKHLITRKISIDTIYIENPILNLEVSTKGNTNWDFKKLLKDKQPTIKNIAEKIRQDEQKLTQVINSPKFEIAIKSIKIENATINYDNRKIKYKDTIKINDFFLYSKSFTDPIFINTDFIYKNGKYKGSFKTYSFEDIINQTKTTPFIGIANINGLDVNFVSKIEDINNFSSFSGNLQVSSKDLQKSLNNIIPDFPNIKAIDGEIDIIATPKIISIKNFALNYEGSKINGNLETTLNKKPNIKLNVHIPLFDIPKLFFPLWEPAYFERLKTGASKPHKEHKYIEDPKAFRGVPLPIKEFNLADIILNVKIDKLKAMPEMEVNNIRLNANLNNGTATISPLSFDYMGGKVLLEAISSNKNNRFNGDVSIKATDVNIGKIISSTGYKDIFTGGNANVDIVLKGYGKNLAEFMKNLNGYVKVYTTSNLVGYRIEKLLLATDLVSSIFRFISDDIVGTLTGKEAKDEKSTIECAVVNLNIKDGQTTSNRGIAVQTKAANIIIDGLVNLGDEYLDVSIITIVKEGLQMSNSLAEMIKIEGPMARPSIIISKDGVINNVAKTAFTTALVGALTGGVTLITAGIGVLTKSWITNIREDKNPCYTAFEGGAKGQPKEDYDDQIILREQLNQQIQEEKLKLNEATKKNINKTKQEVKSQIKK